MSQLPIPTSIQTRNSKKIAFAIIKWTLLAVVLYYVGYKLAGNLKDLGNKEFHIQPWYVVLSGVAFALVTVVQISAYRLLLRAYGNQITWPQAATLSWLPALGKYAPAKVASITYTLYLLQKYKIQPAIAVSVTLLGDALAVMAGLIVGAPLLRWPAVANIVPGGMTWMIVIVASGLVCLYPPIFIKLVNWALGKLKKSPLTSSPTLAQFIPPVLAAFAQWVLWGLSLWCITRSLADVSITALPAFITMIALANSVAYLAIFAPGGIGVREGILLVTLASYVSPEIASVAVIALRVMQTIVEVILAVCGWVFLRRQTVSNAQ